MKKILLLLFSAVLFSSFSGSAMDLNEGNEDESITVIESELNNSPDTANVISNNFYGQNDYIILGTITYYWYDLDFFKFNVTKSGTFDILGIWSGDYLGYGWEDDLVIRLMDGNENWIATSILKFTDMGYFQHLVADVSPGIYYIVVSQTPYYETLYVGESYGVSVEFHAHSDLFNISVSSNPAEGGSVSGGGTFEDGQKVTVKATPNTGYEFVNWTEDGQQVSTNANYTFTVSSERNLIANFQMDVGSSTLLPGVLMLLLDDEE